ncbi:MAG: glycosyltransferase family 39 protein [Thermoanaerobaculia bacterium]
MSRRVLALALAVAALYLLFLGRHGLHESDEGRYAEIAREMKESGDLLIPTLNGVPHFQKPPVIYWSTAVSLAVLGENEGAARMVSLLAALGVLVLTYWIGRWWFDSTTGLAAAWILAGSWQFFMLGRSLTPDMMMTFWATAAIAGFVWASRSEVATSARFLPYFTCMGIAFATKGPMGILVPLLTGLGWQWGSRTSDRTRVRIPWIAGLTLTLVLALGWFIAASLRHPELGRYFFEFELVNRFLSKTHGRSQPIWYFIPILLVGWLPWTPLIPLAISGNRERRRRGVRDRAIDWALVGWLVVPLVLLSLSGSKLMTYVLPLFPGIALWLANGLLPRGKSRALSISVAVQMVLLVGLTLTVGVLLARGSLLPPTVELDDWFLPLLGLAVACVVGAGWFLSRGVTESRLAGVTLSALLVWMTLASQLVHLGPVMRMQASMRPVAERLREEPDWETAQIIIAHTRAHGLKFYLGRLTDATLDKSDVVLEPTSEIAERIHPSIEELRIRDDGRTATYLVTRERELKRLEQREWTVIAQEGAFMLLRREAGNLQQY